MFFFNDTATTEIYTLSLHDALPILVPARPHVPRLGYQLDRRQRRVLMGDVEERRKPIYFVQLPCEHGSEVDRKSTRLNSSHANISYAVFCLKKILCLKKNHH